MPELMIDGHPIAMIDDMNAAALLKLAGDVRGFTSQPLTMSMSAYFGSLPWEPARPRAPRRQRWAYDATLELRFVKES